MHRDPVHGATRSLARAVIGDRRGAWPAWCAATHPHSRSPPRTRYLVVRVTPERRSVGPGVGGSRLPWANCREPLGPGGAALGATNSRDGWARTSGGKLRVDRIVSVG